MATYQKTIRVPVNFGNIADVADNVLTTLGTPTIYIPENSVAKPVTFKSVMVFCGWQDSAPANITTWTFTLTLAGAAASAKAITGSITSSGEDFGGIIGPTDYTSYFVSNFGTGTSKALTFAITVDVGTGITRGAYAWVELTYEYDNSATVGIQTICIPYDSYEGTLTTTPSTKFQNTVQLVGTGGILAGYGSTGLTTRYHWMELKGNFNNNAGTTDTTLSYRWDGGATSTLPIREAGGATDTWQFYFVDATGLSGGTGHNFQLWSSLASRFSNLVSNEWVTFEYTKANVTEPVNYIEHPLTFTYPVGTTAGNANRDGIDIIIPEPAPITLLNSAINITYNSDASATPSFRVGAQNYRSFPMAASVVGGAFEFQQRFDSGATGGEGASINRGINFLTADLYCGVGVAYNVTGFARILYKSGVSSSGLDSHQRVVTQVIFPQDFTLYTSNTVNAAFSIPETNYYIPSVGFKYCAMTQPNKTQLLGQRIEYLNTDVLGAGFKDIYMDYVAGDNELTYSDMTFLADGLYQKTPGDPGSPGIDLIDIETSRGFNTWASTALRASAWFSVTYFSSYTNVSGYIYYIPDVYTLFTFNLYMEINGAYQLVEISGASGGSQSYAIPAYLDMNLCYVVIKDNYGNSRSTKVDYPGAGFDVDFRSPEAFF